MRVGFVFKEQFIVMNEGEPIFLLYIGFRRYLRMNKPGRACVQIGHHHFAIAWIGLDPLKGIHDVSIALKYKGSRIFWAISREGYVLA